MLRKWCREVGGGHVLRGDGESRREAEAGNHHLRRGPAAGPVHLWQSSLQTTLN
jgi:hypothetical protein